MMLSPIPPHQLRPMLHQFSQMLSAWPAAQSVFDKLATTLDLAPALEADLWAGHDKAVTLAQSLGIPTCDEEPAQAFSWDGYAVRTRTETAVLLHEIAHWQLAPPARRGLPDFGLGAGPETGRTSEADAARCVDDAAKEQEEDFASLLGILWELRLGGPAIIAFCEQNWLELPDRPGTADHFVSTLTALMEKRFLDDQGWPIPPPDLTLAA